jgi:hypothetical protein
MEDNKILTIVVRRVDGSFSEKFSVKLSSDFNSDFEDVKQFVHLFMMHGKAKWFEVYEGTNLYFGDFRVKPIYTTRVEE